MSLVTAISHDFSETFLLLPLSFILPFHIPSSFLSLVGMVIGLLLGNIENWSSWIFCATAGIFLYVALVDMVPELNSGHNHPSVSSDHDDEEHRGEHRRDSQVCSNVSTGRHSTLIPILC